MPLPPPHKLAERLAARLAEQPSDAPPDPVREAAVAVALRWQPDPEVLLMQRRARDGDPWSGQVSLPGGHREPADDDLVATARRETLEELAVDLHASADLLGSLPPIQAMARGRRLDLWITPILFHVTTPLDPRPSDEAEAAFWLPLAAARAGQLDHRFHYADETRKLVLPAWRFEERVVWGLTFRMIQSLLETYADPA